MAKGYKVLAFAVMAGLPFSCTSDIESAEDALARARSSSFSGISSSSGTFAQDDNEMVLDVVIRDFPVGHYGFEEFDADRGDNGKCAENSFSCWAGNCTSTSGSYRSGRISNWTPNNRICFTGDVYHSCSENRSGQATLRYGQNDYRLTASSGAIRGYCNGPDKEERFGSDNCNGMTFFEDSVKGNWGPNKMGWSNPVGVTKGMVENWLNYGACKSSDLVGDENDPMYIRGRYCARPMPANGQCYGEYLNEWFTTGGNARTIETVMILKRIGNGNLFEIKYDYNTRTNWNSFGEDMGYFPLDKYSDDETYGKQSLNVWCPNNLSDDDANKPECDAWKARGGPKNGNAAKSTVDAGNVERRKWHNYGFTVSGSGEFKYEQGTGDEFKFIGDDDMWIFIDGKLAVDLGGTHLPAPGKIKIDEWARQEGWENGTKHSINFFYADRQTEGSNMMLQMAITYLKPPSFGRN
jgi:fibro-slime domain-containing protein